MLQSLVISVFTASLWMNGEASSEKILDTDTCIFYYWQVDWQTAVKSCASSEHNRLLCYKSKKEMDDITEAFRLTAIGSAKLAIWLSNRNCSDVNRTEECLALHIQKSGDTVWHYFLNSCSDTHPFVCCVHGRAETTTSFEAISSPSNLASDTVDVTDNSLVTTTHTSSSVIRFPFCKKVWRRGIEWPETDAGKVAILPCPGNSTGQAKWMCEHRKNGRWKDSGPDLSKCRSLEIQNLKENFNSSSSSDVLSALENIFQDRRDHVFGEDLADIISLMTALPDRMFNELESLTSSAKWTVTKRGVNKVASIMDQVVELEDSWRDMDTVGKSVSGTNLLSTVEGVGSLLADLIPENIGEQSIIGKNMALQVLRPKPGESITLPQWVVTSSYSHRGSVIFDGGYDKDIMIDEGNVSLVFTLYSNMSSILSSAENEKGGSLNSAVVSAAITQKRKIVKINSNVKILMEHSNSKPNGSACVFWNMERYQWDTSGCYLESANETSTVCVCNHLTNFALLMDYRDVLSDVDQDAFHYITMIGCIFSIICLALCVIIFSIYNYYGRLSWGVRYVIHRNLCLTLLLANVVLVSGLNRTENQRICSFIAGLLHYFFLSAFSWMFLEGLHIYYLLVVVFASRNSHSVKNYLFGYGFPLLIVLITYISRPAYYGRRDICWLSVEKGTIWAFMGPVAVILILNTAALILAHYKASRISVKNDKVTLIKRWLRVTFILFPVLGITWVLGFLYLGKHFEVAGYLFAVLNSFQGVCIFVFHCLMDKKTRNMVLDSFRKKRSSVTTGSTGTQKKVKGHHHQNGVKSNSITPTDDESNSEATEKTFQPTKEENNRNWFKLHKPWSFCFKLPVQDPKETHNKTAPHAVVICWNSLDKNSA